MMQRWYALRENGVRAMTGLVLALALLLSAALLLPGGSDAVHAQQERDGASSPAPAEVSESSGWRAPWDKVETTGEPSSYVEVIYEEGWVLVGDRTIGVPLYRVPPFQVPSRKVEDVPMYPCMDCHAKHETDYRRRQLKVEHGNIEIKHGGRDFWCTDCHNGKNMNQLISTSQKPIDMDLGYLLCGQCHFPQLKDWHFGAHGKRIGKWQGVRVLRTCPECHLAHAPAIGSFEATPAPMLREGLQRPERNLTRQDHGTARWLRVGNSH